MPSTGIQYLQSQSCKLRIRILETSGDLTFINIAYRTCPNSIENIINVYLWIKITNNRSEIIINRDDAKYYQLESYKISCQIIIYN